MRDRRLLLVLHMFLNTFPQRGKRHPRRRTVTGRTASTLLHCCGLRRLLDPLLLSSLLDLYQFACPLLIFDFPKHGFADRPLLLLLLRLLLLILTAVAVAVGGGCGTRRHGLGPVFSSTNPCSILYCMFQYTVM